MRDPERAEGVVTTIAAKCRRCYTCVRNCPAKAIRVQGGQAAVIPERCIGCGNCLRVCAQNAKQVAPAIPDVTELLASPQPVVAVLAPSYPAAFEGVSAGQVVAACRSLGFAQVMEVGLGAELVAREYVRLLKESPGRTLVSSPCPALVNYVRLYMPDLTPYLAPVVSPMVATARLVKEHILPGASVVFIGPCVAKKAEQRDKGVSELVDAVMTFQELGEMARAQELDLPALDPAAPDGPLPHDGGLFPIAGGLLKTAALEADLREDTVIVVEGPERCISALEEIRQGHYHGALIDALLCDGCVAGPAFCNDMSPLARRALVTAHVRDASQTTEEVARFAEGLQGLDLHRTFSPQGMVLSTPSETELRDILARSNKLTVEQELNCGACGYPTCREKAVAVYQGLAEPEMCLPFLVDQLQVNVERLTKSKEEIERAREAALRVQELASMGELASDIAAEISKPLGTIAAYAQMVCETLAPEDPRREDVSAIVAEAWHAKDVLVGLQGFTKQHEPQCEQTTIVGIIQRGLDEVQPRMQLGSVKVHTVIAPGLPEVYADPELMARVIANVVNNSLDALQGFGAVEIGAEMSEDGSAVLIRLKDNGPGVDMTVLARIFQPFVTTKADRRGAGLGLAVAHGVMRAHGGDIELQSKPGAGTEVTLRLPVRGARPTTPDAYKVMVVDDDPDFLEQHRIILESAGFVVVTAERTDEALQVADREIPDAFLLDLMMERLDSGARLARGLRRDPRFAASPIVMLTSVVREVGFEYYRNPQEVLDWMRADAWFDKPAPIVELTSTLRRLLSGAARGAEGVAEPA
jgi:signal transduction histidine kinase/iron only hydrogenase large subunit-like protein